MSVYNGKPVGILLFEQWHGRQNVGSSRIRGHWLVKYWDEAEIFQQGAKYETVIFQKCYWLDYVLAFKGIKILDMCDPDWLDTVPIKQIIDNCDAVTTSTEELAKEIRKFAGKKPVVFIPDRQDLEFHNYEKYKKVHKGRAKKVIWFGYSHNAKCLDRTIGLLRKYRLELTVLSNFRPPYSKADRNLKFEWGKPGFDFNKIIVEHDFVLLPPRDDIPRGRFKSPNKVYTAWALGMPVARTPEDVRRFLDPEERNKEAPKRLKEIREKYDVRISVKEFKELIKQIKEGKKYGV